MDSLARICDPTTGTFLTRDPLAAMTCSVYGYVNNDPLNRTDPSGKRPSDDNFCTTKSPDWFSYSGASASGSGGGVLTQPGCQTASAGPVPLAMSAPLMALVLQQAGGGDGGPIVPPCYLDGHVQFNSSSYQIEAIGELTCNGPFLSIWVDVFSVQFKSQCGSWFWAHDCWRDIDPSFAQGQGVVSNYARTESDVDPAECPTNYRTIVRGYIRDLYGDIHQSGYLISLEPWIPC